MKTILAPTDFSEVSENAVSYAAELAMHSHAKLILFHGYSVPVPVSPEVPVVSIPLDDIEKENMKLLHKLDRKLKTKLPNLQTELVTRPGFIVDEILSLLNERDADVIVMGLTGAGRSTALIGSNTISIIKKAKKPVLAIPKNVIFEKPKRIALACDYKAVVPDHVINKFKEFVKLFGSKVLVFDVLKKAELVSYEKAVAEVNLENSLTDVEHSLYFPSGDNLEEQVNEFVERNNADMLVVMPHNYNFFAGLFHQHSSRKIALHTHVPLLSIHE